MKTSVRIRFDKTEIGWAEQLGGGKCKINNIPLVDNLNIDDIVECEEKKGIQEIVKLLTRKYPLKSTVSYRNNDEFKIICDKVKSLSFKIEGRIGPSFDRLGVCAIAHDSSVDLTETLKNLGFEVASTEKVN